MNNDEFNYLWTTEKENYVLVKTTYGYGIVDKKEKAVLSISNPELRQEVINKMIQEGNKIYENILEAFNDV